MWANVGTWRSGIQGRRSACWVALGVLLQLVLVQTSDAGREVIATTRDKWSALAEYSRRLAGGTTGFEVYNAVSQQEELRAVGTVELPSGALLNKSAVNYQGCAALGAEQFAFCDMALSTEDRVEDLLSRFTLNEKLGMISPNPMLGDTCVGSTWNGTSLGNASFLKQVISYGFLTETNTDVQASCWKGFDGKDNKCVTNLPGPNCVASTWNRTAWRNKGLVISTEMRALRNVGGWRARNSAPMGITGFGPNMNIQRDVRVFYL